MATWYTNTVDILTWMDIEECIDWALTKAPGVIDTMPANSLVITDTWTHLDFCRTFHLPAGHYDPTTVWKLVVRKPTQVEAFGKLYMGAKKMAQATFRKE